MTFEQQRYVILSAMADSVWIVVGVVVLRLVIQGMLCSAQQWRNHRDRAVRVLPWVLLAGCLLSITGYWVAARLIEIHHATDLLYVHDRLIPWLIGLVLVFIFTVIVFAVVLRAKPTNRTCESSRRVRWPDDSGKQNIRRTI